MPFKYDFSKVKENGFSLLEPGWWPFRITEVEETESKKGNPMVKVVASCLDPDHKDSRVWHWVVFLPEDAKGSGISKHFVKCLGLPVDAAATVDPEDWVGKTFMGKVTIEEYNGKQNNKIGEVSPIKDGAGPAEEEDPFKG